MLNAFNYPLLSTHLSKHKWYLHRYSKSIAFMILPDALTMMLTHGYLKSSQRLGNATDLCTYSIPKATQFTL